MLYLSESSLNMIYIVLVKAILTINKHVVHLHFVLSYFRFIVISQVSQGVDLVKVRHLSLFLIQIDLLYLRETQIYFRPLPRKLFLSLLTTLR